MKEYHWMNEVQRRAQSDEWYQLWRKDVSDLEPAFFAIRDSLSEEQQVQLDDYICACENMKSALILIAYNLGREQ